MRIVFIMLIFSFSLLGSNVKLENFNNNLEALVSEVNDYNSDIKDLDEKFLSDSKKALENCMKDDKNLKTKPCQGKYLNFKENLNNSMKERLIIFKKYKHRISQAYQELVKTHKDTFFDSNNELKIKVIRKKEHYSDAEISYVIATEKISEAKEILNLIDSTINASSLDRLKMLSYAFSRAKENKTYRNAYNLMEEIEDRNKAKSSFDNTNEKRTNNIMDRYFKKDGKPVNSALGEKNKDKF